MNKRNMAQKHPEPTNENISVSLIITPDNRRIPAVFRHIPSPRDIAFWLASWAEENVIFQAGKQYLNQTAPSLSLSLSVSVSKECACNRGGTLTILHVFFHCLFEWVSQCFPVFSICGCASEPVLDDFMCVYNCVQRSSLFSSLLVCAGGLVVGVLGGGGGKGKGGMLANNKNNLEKK